MKTFVLGVIVGLSFLALSGKAHNRPGTEHQERHAITYAFCGHQFKPCRYGNEAIVVAGLESSGCAPWDCGSHDLWAQGRCSVADNGQYEGCFQMGSSERRKYGNGAGVWDQARAAFRYFVASGRDWSPWSCKPWGWCA